MDIVSKITKYINEAKSDYELYHDTYTSAADEALALAKRMGYETDDSETFDIIGTGPKKPSKGKTVKLSIPLYKGGKKQRKALHFQVYNRDTDRNTYELNAYIS